jgi:hypothetical protein
MTLEQLVENNDMILLNAVANKNREITGGVCCDLLSWVMAKGQGGMAWVTVQTHMNVVAVASLHEFSCIILPEGCSMAPDTLLKAQEEGIAVFGTKLSAYAVCCLLHAAGVK